MGAAREIQERNTLIRTLKATPRQCGYKRDPKKG
jgi:hypothetical protein